MLFAVTSEFVTTSEVAPAAKFTEPVGWLIVRAPVVPAGVMVRGRLRDVLVAIVPLTSKFPAPGSEVVPIETPPGELILIRSTPLLVPRTIGIPVPELRNMVEAYELAVDPPKPNEPRCVLVESMNPMDENEAVVVPRT